MLWNLTFLERNRARVLREKGVVMLQGTFNTTDDPILRQNIEGILYMFFGMKPPPPLRNSPSLDLKYAFVLFLDEY